MKRGEEGGIRRGGERERKSLTFYYLVEISNKDNTQQHNDCLSYVTVAEEMKH